MSSPVSLPSRRSWPQQLLKIALFLTLTAISSLVVFEIGFRIFYRLIPLGVCASSSIVGNYYCQPYMVYDKPIRLAYHYQPGYKIQGRWNPADPHNANPGDETRPTGRDDTFWYTFQTDMMGFPNDEYTWRDQYDVVIAGDSFTLRSAPKTWIELLRGQMGVSLLTFGAPSWGPLNEVEAIKQYGLDKHPKWVLVMYFEGNDLYGTGQYLERQPTGLSWKEFDFRNAPATQQLIMPYMIQYVFKQMRGNAKSSAQRYRYPVTASTKAGNVPMVLKDLHLLPMSADYETLAHSDEFLAAQAKLIEIQQLCEARGARFLLVYLPSKEHVYWSRIWDPVDVNNILERTVTVKLSEGDHGHLVYEPQYLSYDVFNKNHNAQELLFDDMTRANHIEFLNLTPTLWQAGIEHGELYNYADPHWNQAGNQWVADTIAEYLKTH